MREPGQGANSTAQCCRYDHACLAKLLGWCGVPASCDSSCGAPALAGVALGAGALGMRDPGINLMLAGPCS